MTQHRVAGAPGVVWDDGCQTPDVLNGAPTGRETERETGRGPGFCGDR